MKTRLVNIFRAGLPAFGAVVLALLSGCAQVPLNAPTPSFDVIEKAKASRTAPVAVGNFQPAPGVNAEIDKYLNVRSNAFFSPYENSFALFLKQTVIADLQASGLYDAASQTTLSGFLTESSLDVPVDIGKASLGARFVLTRAGQKVFEKELKTSASWESSFIGAIAIPAGVNHYTSLYHQLLGLLLIDPDYRNANPK